MESQNPVFVLNLNASRPNDVTSPRSHSAHVESLRLLLELPRQFPPHHCALRAEVCSAGRRQPSRLVPPHPPHPAPEALVGPRSPLHKCPVCHANRGYVFSRTDSAFAVCAVSAPLPGLKWIFFLLQEQKNCSDEPQTCSLHRPGRFLRLMTACSYSWMMSSKWKMCPETRFLLIQQFNKLMKHILRV